MHSGLVDMARDDKPNENAVPAVLSENKYPYGLQISLSEDELEKLDVDHSDWKVGETFHLHAFAKVTSISENQREDGEKSCCVQLQITHLAGESEDEENKSRSAYSEDEVDLTPYGYRRMK